MKAKEEWVDYIDTLHLQNNTEKVDFDRAFKFGIECAVEEILEQSNKRAIRELENVCNRTDKGSILEEYLMARIEQLKQD